MLTPYPTELPVEAFQLVVDAIKGRIAPFDELIHAGWCVVGYGLGLSHVHKDTMKTCCVVTEEDCCKILQECCTGTCKAVEIPWDQVVLIVLTLLKKWLAK